MKDDSGIVDRIGKIRPQRDCAAIATESLFQPALVPQNGRKIVKGLSIVRLKADRPLQAGRGGVQPSQILQDDAEVIVNDRNPRIDGDGPTIGSLRRFELAQLVQCARQVELRLGITRSRRYGPRIGRRRIFVPALRLEQHTEIVVSFRIVRPYGERRKVGLRGALMLVPLSERVAECNMSFGVVRSQFECPLMTADGLRRTALLLQHQSKIVVARRIGWSQRDRLAKQPLGAGEIALLRRDNGKIADGCGVGRSNGEKRSIKSFGIFERAAALRHKRLFQQLLRWRGFQGLGRSQERGGQ
ncbi:MAG TPA: hypothetical protein VKY22_20020 [Bradyrhizobium sp.]|nr:hypothetical protein [Bradyrhizobium sp.]